ncbi:MAG: DUF5103 domain-containing protein [Saprospiraceae bacterium]|nr:DUF5103 domain-containing protein [Saprospiraceae bacterium]
MKYLIIICLLSATLPGAAQHDQIIFDDHVYNDNIRTVKLHVINLLTSIPVIRLRSDSALVLSFDDLDDTPKFYRYQVIHCDHNWKPSDLDVTEFVDGYNDEPIDAFEYSINTFTNYAHYSLSFPNEDLRITKSGNYLLLVYLDDGDRTPVITRRFMVVDPSVSINARIVRPAEVRKLNTHHEIDFEIGTRDVRIINPKDEISVTVLQNGRWDNAITGLRSRFERGDKLIFDYQDKIVFAAGKDFRNMDIRSTQYRSEDVFEILRYDDHYEVVAELDVPRTYANYIRDVDINGQFVILDRDDTRFRPIFEGNDNRVGRAARNAFEDITEHDLKADYLDVYFTLDVDAPYDAPVYIFGALSDWKLQERFRMEYDRARSAYTTMVQLKQGFYDYIYVLGNSDGTPDETTIEGHWFEATNSYTILVYYRPFGGRYDQLIGGLTIESAEY